MVPKVETIMPKVCRGCQQWAQRNDELGSLVDMAMLHKDPDILRMYLALIGNIIESKE